MLRDTAKSYGWVSIVFHWSAAAGVIALYLLGDAIHKAPDRDALIAAIWRHVGVAMVLYLLLASRIIWRLSQPRVEKPAQSKPLSILARVTQWALLALIAFQLVTGPLTVWTRGSAIRVFDWFEIPSPMARMPELHEMMEVAHGWGAKIILAVIVLHVLGALKHAVLDRDGTLMRMVKAGSELKTKA